jgi:serine/threonine protein kinase
MTTDLETEQRAPDAPRTGTVIARKYKLIRVLGEGSYAWVYAASHESVESLRFAVKILKPTHSNNADVLRRFKQEANTIAALQSRHTVRVFDFGVAEDGSPFIVMEYIRGLSLRQLLQKEERLHPLTAARLAAGVLKALVEAHGHGIVHRDLKPSNILVTRPQDEKVPIAKVLDFGIAKVVSADGAAGLNAEETVEGLLFCSPRYASPEILNAKPALQSDLYSLGIIMAEMLEGQAPYNGDNSILVAARHLSEDPVPLGPWVVESGFYNVIQKACAKRLDERYATASEMLDDLETSIRRLEALSGLRTEAQVASVHPSVTGPFTLDGRSVHASLPREVTASATQPVAARDLRRSIEEQLRRAQPEAHDAGTPPEAADDSHLAALLDEGTIEDDANDAAASRLSPPPQRAPTPGLAPETPLPAPRAVAAPVEPDPLPHAADAPDERVSAVGLDAIAPSGPSVLAPLPDSEARPPRSAARWAVPAVLLLLLGAFAITKVVGASDAPANEPIAASTPAPATTVSSSAEATPPAVAPSVPSAPPTTSATAAAEVPPNTDAAPVAVDPVRLPDAVLRAARAPVERALGDDERRLTVQTTPPGAVVSVGGVSRTAPLERVWAPLAAGAVVTVEAPAFLPAETSLDSARSLTLDLRLEPVPRTTGRPGSSGRASASAPQRSSDPAAPSTTPEPAQAPREAAPERPTEAPTDRSSDSLRHSEIRNPWDR